MRDRERRDRGDYIQAFRILRGVDSVKHEVWFDLATDRPRSGAAHTRGTAGVDALEPRKGRTELRRNFFSVRTAEKYNKLPDHVKLATTVDDFKNRLDGHLFPHLSRDAASPRSNS